MPLFFIILITCLFDIVKKNSILVTWSTYRVEEDNLKIWTGKIFQCRDSLRIMALILMFQRQTYHVQTTKIALLRPSASMDYAFVKETEWETAANAEVTSQVDK